MVLQMERGWNDPPSRQRVAASAAICRRTEHHHDMLHKPPQQLGCVPGLADREVLAIAGSRVPPSGGIGASPGVGPTPRLYVKYRETINEAKGGFTLREGTTDYFTKIAYNNTDRS